jgi:hypothetical protein
VDLSSTIIIISSIISIIIKHSYLPTYAPTHTIYAALSGAAAEQCSQAFDHIDRLRHHPSAASRFPLAARCSFRSALSSPR